MKHRAPPIWNTDIQTSANMQRIGLNMDGDALVRLQTATILRDGCAALPQEQVPEYIYFTVYNLPASHKDNMPDLFLIAGGVRVVSERFRDLLMAHELGATAFYEVPFYEYDKTTRRPGRWFFLSVIEAKPTLIPEQSMGIKEAGAKGVYRPDIVAPRELYAVRAASAEGADLWQDPALRERLFLTDRLKRAIKDAGIKARRMTMRKCAVVD
jgi:hypothetical protein